MERLFLLLFFVGGARAQCEVAQACVTDLTAADCGAGMELSQNTAIFNCCPSCVVASGGVTPTPQGCQPPSNCLPDGRYAAVQCKGDQFMGRCFCTDENGIRIFGQMWRDEASEMTCTCSRRRAELEASGRNDVTLHCTRSGDYEPVQCDDGICWCAQPKTGQPTAGPFPEEDMTRLPCYSQGQMGEHYLRRCESVTHSLSMIQKEQREHGTNFLGNPISFCDYDGSYGPAQIVSMSAFCTGRDGEILGPWQSTASDRATMNCNCARDSAVYFPERGMSVAMTCMGNGNYQPNQMSGDLYYCVDQDGYPTTDFMEAWPADNCASYA